MSKENNKEIENFVGRAIENKEKQIDELKQKIVREIRILQKSEDCFQEFVKVTTQKNVEVKKWLDMLREITERNLISGHPEDSSFFKAASFLLLFETGYLTYVDIICLLLTKNGHDIFFRRKYCTSLEEIGLVDTFTKFGFLKEHGFGTIIREDDRQLRNNIAHLNYTIKDQDTIMVGSEENVNIHERVKDLIKFIVTINFITVKALEPLVDS
jgi:hypothetical protein